MDVPPFVEGHLRRIRRNRALSGLLCLAGVALVFAPFAGSWQGWLARPVAHNVNELSALQSAPEPRTCRIATAELVNTPVRLKRHRPARHGMRTTRVVYWLARAGDRAVAVEWRGEEPPTFPLDGVVGSIPLDERSAVAAAAQAHGLTLAPLAVRTSRGRNILAWLGIGVSVLLLGTAIACFARRPTVAVVRIQRSGKAQAVTAQTLAELQATADDPDTETVGSVLVGSRWLVQPTFTGLSLFAVGEIAWAYVKAHRYGRTFYLHMRGGAIHEVRLPRGARIRLMSTLEGRIPWAYFGFDERWEHAWKRRRADFLRGLDERRTTPASRLSG